VFDLDVAPMLFEVFGNQSAVAVVRRFLTAKQTSAVQEFARGVFDVPRTKSDRETAARTGGCRSGA
jgi:predicted RecA/RadA family phage recombinase